MEGWVTRTRFVYQLHHATGMPTGGKSLIVYFRIPTTEGRGWQRVHACLRL